MKLSDIGKAINSNTYTKTVKPFFKEQIKNAKTLSKDTFEFVKNNPKKIGKYAAVGLMIASTGAALVKTIKDYLNVKAQNKILANFVVMQKKSNDELKDYIGVQKEIIAGKDDTIDAQQKIIEDLKK